MKTSPKDRQAIDQLFKEYHYTDDLGVIKSKLAGYVAGVRREARAAAFKEAFTIMCPDCAEGDEPTFDEKARWYYHGESSNAVGCSASKLRIEAATTKQPTEVKEGDDG